MVQWDDDDEISEGKIDKEEKIENEELQNISQINIEVQEQDDDAIVNHGINYYDSEPGKKYSSFICFLKKLRVM